MTGLTKPHPTPRNISPTAPRGRHRRAGAAPSLSAALATALIAVLAACGGAATNTGAPPAMTEAEHRRLVEAWQDGRDADLRQPDSWLSLVGLMWLEEGDNTFGADDANDLVYAAGETPSHLGTFVVEGESVRFEAADGVTIGVLGSDQAVDSMIVRQPPSEDGESHPTPVLTWGPLQWHVIRRLDQFALRLKDTTSPVLTGFEGLESFPIDSAWRLAARFEAYEPPRTIGVPNVLGNVAETESPGAVVFEAGGQTHRIDVWYDSEAEDGFFTVFADETNRETTYGGGRFLWIDKPDDSGHTVIDFNRAYNPPCVFTNYATCPLPPEQNRLSLAVEAGERMYRGPATPAH